MNLSGPIVLCGRSSNDTVRGYNGRLTHLALFDQALTPLEAYAIYMQVPLSALCLQLAALSPAKIKLWSQQKRLAGLVIQGGLRLVLYAPEQHDSFSIHANHLQAQALACGTFQYLVAAAYSISISQHMRIVIAGHTRSACYCV